MHKYQELLAGFPLSRETRLKNILRYSNWEVFFYRSSVWHHAWRVTAMVEYLAPIAESVFFLSQVPFDGKKAVAIATVHDDAEMITDDIPASEKDNMNSQQLEELKCAELAAIDMLANEFPPTFMGYSYRQLLLHSAHKDCLEAQMVSYLDKLDAYCETMHEVFAGNITALRGVIAYVHRLTTFKNTYPGLAPLFERGNSPFLNIGLRRHHSCVRWEDYTHLNRPHTRQSIYQDTEFLFYNLWKELIVRDLGEEGVGWLTTQVEGLETEVPPVLALVS